MLGKLRRFWKWLWNSNSLLSWIVSFLFAFIIVRFIFYPFLGLLLGTSLPLVVVETCSMEHFDEFDKWWSSQEEFYEEFDITKEDAKDWPLKNGLNQGDISVIKRKDFDSLEIGEVIVFRPSSDEQAIIHRIVGIAEDGRSVETKGDSNARQLPNGREGNIKPEQIEGVAILRVPVVGWIKLAFVGTVKC